MLPPGEERTKPVRCLAAALLQWPQVWRLRQRLHSISWRPGTCSPPLRLLLLVAWYLGLYVCMLLWLLSAAVPLLHAASTSLWVLPRYAG